MPNVEWAGAIVTASGTAQPSNISQRRAKRRGSASARSDGRWASILTATATVFHELGYDRASLDDVAAAVGISRASLYYYVSTKAELLGALLTEPLTGYVERLEASAAQQESASGKLRAVIVGHMELLAKNYPELMILLNEKNLIDDPALHALIRENSNKHRNLLERTITDGVRRKEFRSDLNPTLSAIGILGMCNDTRYWWKPGRKTLPEVGDTFADLIVAGVLRR